MALIQVASSFYTCPMVQGSTVSLPGTLTQDVVGGQRSDVSDFSYSLAWHCWSLFTVTCLVLLGPLRRGIQVFRHRGRLLNGATDYLQLHLSRSGASPPPLKVGMLVTSLINKMQWSKVCTFQAQVSRGPAAAPLAAGNLCSTMYTSLHGPDEGEVLSSQRCPPSQLGAQTCEWA